MAETKNKPNSALHIEFELDNGNRYLITSEMYNPFVLKRLLTIKSGPNKGKIEPMTIGYYSEAKYVGKYLADEALTGGKTITSVQALGDRMDEIANNFGKQLDKLVELAKSSSGN